MKSFSFGTIPYRYHEGVLLFLLIVDAKGGHWTYPKGRPEGNETIKQTALRELEEETSLIPDAVLEHEPLVQEYSFVNEGKTVERRLEFIIVRVDNPQIRIKPDEVLGYRWMTYEEVLIDTPFPALHENTIQAREIIENQHRV